MSSLMVCLRDAQQFCINCCCPKTTDEDTGGVSTAAKYQSGDTASITTTFDLSKDLEDAMREAGFTKANVEFHILLITFLEEEFFKKEREKERKIYGSYGDGWGFNFSCMDGTISEMSNVNVYVLNKFGGHFKTCACDPAPNNPIITVTDLGNGVCQGAFGKDKDVPVTTYPAMSSCPNVEECLALDYSCTPTACSIFTKRKLSENLTDKCKKAGIIIVNTRRPWEVRQDFHLSYIAMERELIRSLPEIMGQSLVFFKYLLKTRLKGYGLKSYCAKSLILYIMAECDESLVWPVRGGMLEVVVRGVRLLIHFLQSYNPENESICMPNFFQEDMPILFRSTERPNKRDLIVRLEAEIDLIENTTTMFMRQLRKPNNLEYFCQVGTIYAGYGAPVHTLLNNKVLKSLDETFPMPSYVESVQSHWQDISQNVLMSANPSAHGPISVRLTVEMLSPKQHTVRLALETLLLIEEGYQERAISVLKDSLGHNITHLKCRSHDSPESTKQYFSQHFLTNDSNWCIYYKNRHAEYLPSIFHELFIRKEIVINFVAVLNVLRRQLIGEDFQETDWYKTLKDASFPDTQEIFAFAMTCKSVQYLQWSLDKLENISVKEKQKEIMCKSITARIDNINKRNQPKFV